MLIEFSVAPWRGEHMWGGGHNRVSDPTQVWSVRVTSPGVILVGRKTGVKGCFTARLMGDGRVGVAVYPEETPAQILVARAAGNVGELDPVYVRFRNIPGWGMNAVDRLADAMYIDELDRQGLY